VDVSGLGWLLHPRGDLDATELFDGSLEVDGSVTVSQ
jgi:hypothetical protein